MKTQFAIVAFSFLSMVAFTGFPGNGGGPQYQMAEADPAELEAFMDEQFQKRERFKEKGNSGRYLKYHNFDL
jgi:hypothetical protein